MMSVFSMASPAGLHRHHLDIQHRRHLLAETPPVFRAPAVGLDVPDVAHRAARLDETLGVASGADDPQGVRIRPRQVLGRDAVGGRGADRVQMIVRDDGRHLHVFPVEEADDLGAIGALVSRVNSHRGGANVRNHARQDPDVVPQMTRVFGMFHGQALEVERAALGLLAQHLLDDRNRFPVSIPALDGLENVFFRQKQHDRVMPIPSSSVPGTPGSSWPRATWRRFSLRVAGPLRPSPG